MLSHCAVSDDAAMTDGEAAASQAASFSLSADAPREVDAAMADAEEEQLTKNDAWHVITSYFDEKGLVRQQLDR